MSRIVVCKGCGQEKPHHAKGLCHQCYQRQWLGLNPECRRAYRKKWPPDPEYMRDYLQDYRKMHEGQIRLSNQEYRKANPEKRRAYTAEWRRNNLDKSRAYWRIREARKRNTFCDLTSQDIGRLLEMGKSMYPGESLHLHHIVPLSKKGNTTSGNIIALPASINISRRDKLPEEVYEQLAFAVQPQSTASPSMAE